MQQLDIFADSLSVQRANTLIDALSRFDLTASRKALHALMSDDPEHTGLPHFRTLCEFIDNWPATCAAPGWSRSLADVSAAQQRIVEQVMPAVAIMGAAGDILLRKIWSDLARASEANSIGPEHHDCFAAELYLRAWQYPDVVRTAQLIPGADNRVRAQRWLALGHYGGRETEPARRAALRYAWLAPQKFPALLREMNAAALTKDWRDFQAALGDLDATWFPAWCAHEKKAGATILDKLPPGDGPMGYHLVTGLVIRERGGLCPAVIEDRARLKRLNESFFAFYLARRS